MTSKSFRRLFPQLNVQSIPEDEFYRQASLSQLLTGPDEQELASFRPDIKDPLELVEATPELAGMLGSSLEFVDTRWDSLEATPPPTPSPPPSQRLPLRPPQRGPSLLQQGLMEAGAKTDTALQNRSAECGQFQGHKSLGYSTMAVKMETKMDANMWELHQLASKNSGIPVPAKPNVTRNMWELQRQQSKNTELTNSANPDSKIGSNESKPQRQPSNNIGFASSANAECKTEPCMQQQQQHGNRSMSNTPVQSDAAVGVSIWEPQRLRSRNADTKMEGVPSEPPPMQNKSTANLGNSDGTGDANTWTRQHQGGKTGAVSDSITVDNRVWESQRLRSKNAAIASPAKPNTSGDVSKWERQGIKRVSGSGTAPKRDANFCDQGGKTIKMDPAWQRNLGNVRVHIRDLGMKVGGGTIWKDVKKEQGKSAGKVARVKTRS